MMMWSMSRLTYINFSLPPANESIARSALFSAPKIFRKENNEFDGDSDDVVEIIEPSEETDGVEIKRELIEQEECKCHNRPYRS